MKINRLSWAAVGITAALFAAVDIITLLLAPAPPKGNPITRIFVFRTVIAGVVTLVALPFLFGLYERQQDRIERQGREIETLHAMDTAIVAEMELSRILDVALRSVLRALNAEASGLILTDPPAEAFAIPERNEEDQKRFAALLRKGSPGVSSGATSLDPWEACYVPLVNSEQREVGRLAAGRSRPGAPFNANEKALLTALAGTVMVAVSNARALEAAREAVQVRADLERERRVAQALTEGLLPQVPEQAGPWAFSRCYRAQSAEAQVGGDIYDVFELPGEQWAVLIADVSGKGLQAAKKTAMVKYALRSYAREHESPAQVVQRLNEALFDEPDLTGFVTLFYGVLEPSGNFRYASAGHEPPVLRRRSGDFEQLGPTGLVLGVDRGVTYEDALVTLYPGDGLLLFTDGLSEAREPGTGGMLEAEGIMEMLRRVRDCPAVSVTDALLSLVGEFTKDRLTDDLAMVWVERTSPGTS